VSLVTSELVGWVDSVVRANGELSGYPPCCVDAFCADLLAGRSPAEERGGTPDGYVPCPVCAEGVNEDGK
jgi:hypothetical protein